MIRFVVMASDALPAPLMRATTARSFRIGCYRALSELNTQVELLAGDVTGSLFKPLVVVRMAIADGRGEERLQACLKILLVVVSRITITLTYNESTSASNTVRHIGKLGICLQ